jgi:methionine-rich copper-binding protein CopC
LAAVCIAVLVCAGEASAHTELMDTTPSEGDRLDGAPARIVLSYSAPLGDIVETSVEVGGAEFGRGAQLAPTDAGRVVIPVQPGAPSGRFVVRWVVRSADGHQLPGELTFTVARSALSRAVEPVARALIAAAGRLRLAAMS